MHLHNSRGIWLNLAYSTSWATCKFRMFYILREHNHYMTYLFLLSISNTFLIGFRHKLLNQVPCISWFFWPLKGLWAYIRSEKNPLRKSQQRASNFLKKYFQWMNNCYHYVADGSFYCLANNNRSFLDSNEKTWTFLTFPYLS